eukprot:2376115-Prorocentrum_lima.AAC.1
MPRRTGRSIRERNCERNSTYASSEGSNTSVGAWAEMMRIRQERNCRSTTMHLGWGAKVPRTLSANGVRIQI